MARKGFYDFLQKEHARRSTGKGVPPGGAATTLLEGCAPGTPFKLPEAQAKMLEGIASKPCFRCKGTGVCGWRGGGTAAVVCRCVRQRIPAMQAALLEQKQKLEAELAAAKKEGTDATGTAEGGPAPVAEGEARKEG